MTCIYRHREHGEPSWAASWCGLMKRSLGQCGASADATAPQEEKRAPGRPPNKRKNVIQECKGVPGGCGGGRCSKKLYTADLCECWGVKHPRRHMKTRELDAQQQSKKRRKERQHPFRTATLRSSKPPARRFYSVDVCCGGGHGRQPIFGLEGLPSRARRRH